MTPSVVFAPGKLFAIGEYAVLHGAQALVAALGSGIRVSAHEATSGVSEIVAPDLGLAFPLDRDPPPAGRLLAAAASAGFAEFGVASHATIEVSASHPDLARKSGLGGSSASAVAILGAIAAALARDLSSDAIRRRIFALAAEVGRSHQSGRGSGADAAAAVYGGWIRYAPAEGGPRIEPAGVPSELRMAAAWSGEVADTGRALADYSGFATSPAGTRLVASLRATLDRFWSSLARDDRPGMLEAISRYGNSLAEIPGADRTGRVQELVSKAREVGAAAKSSGAVGGDCVIALAFDEPAIRAAEDAWRRAGARVLDVSIDGTGVREENLDA